MSQQLLEGYRLSPQQRRLFVLHPEAEKQRLYGRVRLRGPLDATLLSRAFEQVVSRHESLRTSFHVAPGMELPLQIINEECGFGLEQMTAAADEPISEWAAGEWQQWCSEEGESAAGGLRVRVLQVGEREHELWLSVPELCADRRGLENLVREVAGGYEQQLVGGRETRGEDEPAQYLQFSEWQNELLETAGGAEGRAYWQAGALGRGELRLPLERAVREGVRRELQRERLEMSAAVVQGLAELSEEHGSSLEELLLGSWYLLLWRLTGETEIEVEVQMDGRKFAETEKALGRYASSVSVYCNFNGLTSINGYFRTVKKAVRRARGRQEYYNWEEHYATAGAAGERIGFSYSEQPQREAGSELEWEWEEVSAAGEAWKLELRCERRESVLVVEVSYESGRYEAAEMQWLMKRYERVLAAIAGGKQGVAADVEIVSEEEREQQLVGWNQTTREYESEQCIQQLFEAQVERTPEAVALVYQDEQLSYAELNERANQLAHYLRGLGVGPEVLVGICVERSLEMVVGVLGILKAGGAYVPLDVEYPLERLSFMLEDAGVGVLLTQARLEEKLPAHAAQVVCLDSEWEQIAEQSTANPECLTTAENLCYVIYTSGSTGEPKGVLIPHRGVTRLLCNVSYVQLDHTRVLLQLAPLSFDASTFELWGALLHGGSCVLWAARLPSAGELRAGIARYGITTMWLTASLFNAVVDEEEAALGGLKQLLIGGEALSVSHVRRARAALPEVEIINGYGPTESTTFSCCESIGEVESGARGIPIGRAIANTEVYVLDQGQAVVPVGVVGELYIGGAGLARGYLNQPELTAEKFVKHPFSEAEAARLYRTGDLVRYLSDGRLEFVGRLDSQVKVRGYRIELGEIEAVLSRHSGVKECVVVAREEENGDKRLVAYVVSDVAFTTSELRSYLQEKLPEHMVPAAFVALEELPLTRNGKVDRQALPAPEQMLETDADYVAPRTPVEEIVAGIWSEVLKLRRVGRMDNFFELGGHSLLATQVISRIRKSCHVQLPLRKLFENPTVAVLAENIEATLRGEEETANLPLVPVDRIGPIPLSFAQQRLWFIDQMEPGSSIYNVPLAVRLSGELNVMALEQTLSEIVKRHESLRTSFVVVGVGSEPVQVIAPVTAIPLPVTDLSLMAEEEREAQARRLAGEEARRPFDLSIGPLFRAQLLCLSQTEYVLLCTMHHVVSDGWSMGVLVREVVALYEAFLAGETSPLPELSIQYADFAAWQRQWLTGEVLDSQLSYWKQQLQGTPAMLELPTDRPRPAVRSYRGARHSFQLSEELSTGLKELSRQEGATLFMVLLAAFDVLLSRYTGQDDIVVGTDIANRTQVETEQLIGFFINQLVLRTDVSDNPTFRELLGRVREMALGAYAHQDIPFEKLVEELQPERDLSRSPLFQVLFVLQNAPHEAAAMSGLRLGLLDVGGGAARFDLFIAMSEAAGGIRGVCTYRTDLFNAESIARLTDHFQILLQRLLANPDQTIDNVPLLSEAELEQQLVKWNQTAREYETQKCLHQVFEAQVERTPEAVAVVYEAEQLTYAELNARANQLAHYLRGLGVGPEVLVGICLERSLEMMVGVLGILKAGGAYLPLDPDHPLERLGLMIDDAVPAVVLTLEEIAEHLPAHLGHVINLDTEWKRIAAESEENPACQTTGENLCYVIYTSGSTGQPKGVLIPHRALVNYSCAFQDGLGEPRPRSYATVSTFAADLGHTAIFPALCTGAVVHVMAQARVMDGARLAEYFAAHEVECMKIVPSHLRALFGAEGSKVLPRRVVVVGGEGLRWEWARAWAVAGGCRVVNHYGPTECTVGALMGEVGAEALAGAGAGLAPLGRALGNTEVYVLDKGQEVVPVGVVGELYLGGAGLARGYLNQPELTAEKFVKHPFSEDGEARLYRTGDLVRYLSDGRLEFVGRLDHQVKVRGYRVELGEVETALNRHSGVKECVVVAREEESGDKRLVAYVVPASDVVFTPSELRSYLKEKLPEYMVPSAFVELVELPLTRNGKVDRESLPAPEQMKATTAEQCVAPHSAVEEIIAGIWSEVLKVERVSSTDNFFELGGHSLLATQVISRVREACGTEVGLRHLFERPRLSEFAGSVEEEMRAGDGPGAAPLERASREGRLPLSFAQQRLWFIDQLEPGSNAYNVPAAVRLNGELNIMALEQTLSEIVSRHEVLRTTFVVVDTEPEQIIAPASPIPLPITNLSTMPEAEREAETRRLTSEEARCPFDLSVGPMFRAQLLRLSDTEHVLLCTMHHVVSDGWSMGVLIREVAALYQAFSAGEPSPLPELSIQYADFAAWQRQWLTGEVLESQLSYWKQQLQGAPAVLEIPTDRPRLEMRSYRGARHSFQLSAELSAGLKELSRREGATLFMVLLAAFDVLLSRYSGQEDIVIGTDIANRNRSQTEQLIGFFINQLVIRTDVSGNPTFRELLGRVREVSLGAYAHQDIPFEKLVEELRPERDLSRSPLFQHQIVLQNLTRETLQLTGLNLRAVNSLERMAKVDLLILIIDGEEELKGIWTYNTDLFEAATIARMQGHFETLLTSIVAQPESRVSTLEMLTEAEKEALAGSVREQEKASLRRLKSPKQKQMIRGCRLSPQQRRLFVLHSGAERRRLYGRVLLSGEFDAALLSTALEQVVSRHESLRTSFHALPGMELPLQVINEDWQFGVERVSVPVGEKVREWAAREWEKWCNEQEELGGESVGLRVRVVERGEREHELLLSVPELCGDRRGVENLVREVAQGYEQLKTGRGATTDDEPMQYADFSEWQNELLESEEGAEGRAYWVSGRPDESRAELRLPLERVGRESETGERRELERERLAVSAGVVRGLQDVSRERGNSMEELLLGSWFLLLWRLTGEAEIEIEVEMSGRKFAEMEAALGRYALSLPVRLEVGADYNVTELLELMSINLGDARRRQEYYNWEEQYSSAWGAGQRIGFSYSEQAVSERGSELQWAWEQVAMPGAAWKLELRCERQGGELVLEAWYDDERYEAAEMNWLVKRYERVLAAVAGGEQGLVAEIEIVSEEEREQQLVGWNQTAREYASESCLQQLFEAQVERTPEAVAVVYEAEQLTYAELNARANQLAHYLRGLGVGPEVLVGLCLERSLEMLVGVLGILKAGGAYVPLDPSNPAERLGFMLADAAAPVLVTQSHLLSVLPEQAARIVCVDGDWPVISEQSTANPACQTTGENLCYVIYTSGSTGQPKGVLIPHRALVNYSCAFQDGLGEPRPRSYATVSTFAADLGHTAIFPALCTGAVVHVMAQARVMDGARLAEYFAAHEVECMKIVPSHLRALFGAEGSKVLPRRVVVVGGEGLRWEWARAWAVAGGCRVVNHYGPTECTVGALMGEVGAEALAGAGAGLAPLGRALGNTEVYVLDKGQEVVPVGVVGELYLGGAGLARGYLNQPELTAEKFVKHPFSEDGEARLYRTGDLVRYLSDGRLEFVGRLDHQVKVRGYRVELGEVETALNRHSGVKECVVVAREEESGDKRLVAYVVLRQEAALDSSTQSRYTLPNQMRVVHQNKNETDYLYHEIFEKQSYFQHGISLPANACVFDVGANIGLFSLYVGQEYPQAKIYAFEPIAPIFDNLQTNLTRHGLNASLFPYGLSDGEREARFTYYPRYTMMSGLSAYADAEGEERAIKSYLANEGEGGSESAKELLAHADELVAGRFTFEEHDCRLRRLSDVMKEEGVERIDLLKVDVQRAELDVLRGISSEDWKKIRQIVMEVHDEQGTESEGRLLAMTNLLHERDFEIVVDQDKSLEQIGRFNLSAIRKNNELEDARVESCQQRESLAAPEQAPLLLTVGELRKYLKESLPEYMIPSAFVELAELPLTQNGKINWQALPPPEQNAFESETNHVAPQTPIEEIVAGIWRDALKVEQVGSTDNFFERGGHSLLATHVISQIRQACQVDLSLLTLFEKPTVAGLADSIETLMRAGLGVAAPPLERASRDGELPLSFAQQRLWFIDQLEPGNTAYNIPSAVRLSGDLNVMALEQTLSEIMRRHESLRTSFAIVNSEPVQVIAAVAPLPMPITDLSLMPEADREVKVRRLAGEEARQPFDLSTGPLFRAQLLRLARTEHVLLCTMHHIVSDGWSMGVLIREVTALYQAFSAGKPSPLPELSIQYADFAAWQRQWLRGEVLDSQLSYWKQQLQGAPAMLELPTDRPRPAVRSYRGTRHSFKLSEELSEGLKELSRREGATLFMVLLAAFDVLLSRYTGQDDIVVGSPIANRNRAETEALIGFFLNQLVMRTNLSGDPSFRELVRRVRELSLGAYMHQDIPFEKLVEELQPERDINRSPLCQVTFGLRNLPKPALEMPGLALSHLSYEKNSARLDLTLWMWETPRGLNGVWNYSNDLFDASTITHMQEHFVALLQEFVAHPDNPLSTLEMITEAEKEERNLLRTEREAFNIKTMKTSRRRAVV